MSGKSMLILGASGRSGILTLKLALENGHKVTAYVRNEAKLREKLGTDAEHNELTVLEGDLPSASAVLKPLLSDFHAIISLLGPTSKEYLGTQISELYEWMLTEIRTLPAEKRPYLLAMGTQSIVDPEDGFNLFTKLHILFIMWMAPGARVEIMGIKRVFMEEVTSKKTDVDWTVYRLNLLKDWGLPIDGTRDGYVGDAGWIATMDRAQLASWLLSEAEKEPGQRKWARKMPALWGVDSSKL